MKHILPTPLPHAIVFEDDQLYACLANHPLAKGHTVIVWKDNVDDLHLLERNQYSHLMKVVNAVRNALLEVLKLEKVYLVYMDETKQVHWHLIPRYTEKGFDVFEHEPTELQDTSLAHLLSQTQFITDL